MGNFLKRNMNGGESLEKEIVFKVTAYITRIKGDVQQLLVFREQGFEHLGLQVPGGTVEKNEELLDALKREIQEEVGTINAVNIELLGESFYYSEKLKKNVKRYYYQMEAQCPDAFTHTVTSADEDNGWIYNYLWVDIDERLTLFGSLGDQLNQITHGTK